MYPPDNFLALLDELPEARKGSMFGYPSLNIGRKPFVFWHADTNDHVAFKLPPELHPDLLARDGFSLFDPAGKGKPMKAWIQVPSSASDEWPVLAKAAHQNLLDELSK